MSIDTRDHYTDRLRQRTGYTERAKFRVALGRPRWIKPTRGPSAFAGVAMAIAVAASLLFFVATVARALT